MNFRLRATGALAFALTIAGAASALADTPPPAPGATNAHLATPTADERYNVQCQGCHEPAVAGAPTRDELKRRSPERVLESISTGVMAPFAYEMTAAERAQLAVYVTGKELRSRTP